MSKLSFIERVKARIKGGDDLALSRLQIETNKYLDKQIKLIEERIEENTVLVEEKEAELEEFVETPNFNSILKSEQRKEYIKEVYVAGYDRIVKSIDELKVSIEKDTLLIEKRKAMKAYLD